jgi:hypothetical protein
LIEFKYTESISVDALLQTASNHRLYFQSHKEEIIELKSFIISSKQPQDKTLERLGFTEYQAGIYHSDNCFIADIPLISLNTLPNTERNAWIRCFASKKQERKKAFDYLDQVDLKKLSQALRWAIMGLRNIFFGRPKVDTENLLMEPEEIMRVGKFWEKSWEKGYLDSLSPEERLQGLDAETVLSHFDSDTVLNHFDSDTVLSHFDSDTVLSHFDSDTVLSHFDSETILKHLTPEQIEAYLKKIKPTLH